MWGVDRHGERFLNQAEVRDISLSGALFTGVDVDLCSGDVVGVLYQGKKARFRVVWVRYDDGGEKIQVALHRIEADPCPWRELLQEESAGQTLSGPSPCPNIGNAVSDSPDPSR
jgi:hypothetical protein